MRDFVQRSTGLLSDGVGIYRRIFRSPLEKIKRHLGTRLSSSSNTLKTPVAVIDNVEVSLLIVHRVSYLQRTCKLLSLLFKGKITGKAINSYRKLVEIMLKTIPKLSTSSLVSLFFFLNHFETISQVVFISTLAVTQRYEKQKLTCKKKFQQPSIRS